MNTVLHSGAVVQLLLLHTASIQSGHSLTPQEPCMCVFCIDGFNQ